MFKKYWQSHFTLPFSTLRRFLTHSLSTSRDKLFVMPTIERIIIRHPVQSTTASGGRCIDHTLCGNMAAWVQGTELSFPAVLCAAPGTATQTLIYITQAFSMHSCVSILNNLLLTTTATFNGTYFWVIKKFDAKRGCSHLTDYQF